MDIFTNFAAACATKSSFLSFPTWYEYLPNNNVNGQCDPKLASINDVWLIVAAVIEILLRVAALAAVGMVIYGGVQYMTSQGNPEDTTKARGTLINALVGLLLAVMSATFIQFIATRFHAS